MDEKIFKIPFGLQHPPNDRDHDALIRLKHGDHSNIFRSFGIWNEKDKKNSNGDNDEGRLDPFGMVGHNLDYNLAKYSFNHGFMTVNYNDYSGL
jgi:hypothetical protein